MITLLDEVVEFDGLITTARQMCDFQNLPYDVYLWRKSRGLTGKMLFQPCPNTVYYRGKTYNIRMLSEEFGVEYGVLKERYARGDRGDKLVRAPGYDMEGVERRRLAHQCREHLKALFFAHPDRRENAFRKVIKGELEPFDEAQARANARRFEQAGRQAEIRSTGVSWDMGRGEAA